MKLSHHKFKLLFAISILFLASLACQTILGPTQDISTPPTAVVVEQVPTKIPANTNTPEQPETQTSPPQDAPTAPLPTDNPTNTPEPRGEDVKLEDLDDLFAPYWETWQVIHERFVDQPVDDEAMMLGSISGIQSTNTITDTSLDVQRPSPQLIRELAVAAGTPDDLVDLFLPFWEAWITAEAPKDKILMRAAIHGSLNALNDQHTSYMDPDQFRQANIPLEGEYEGIGAWVDPNEEYLTIVSPMPNSPAERAGLQPGDQIIKVDGEDMTGIDGNLVIRRVLGPAGSDVVLTIRRGELEPFDVTVTRGRIVIPSVDGRMVEEGVAYIQLFQFAEKTRDDMRSYLVDMLAQNPKGLILDLRNNGGGYLRTAVEVTSEFISEGIILREIYGNSEEDQLQAIRGGLALNIPLVILVNEGSASASEIVAGAIQDYGRGVLIGTTTFGKGSVQSWIPLRSDGGAVRVTIARWYTPEGRLIHGTGLEPDFFIEITEEDFENGIDPQLERAIEYILTGQ